MSEEKKKSTKQARELHVDTLHIHAKEIVLHQDGATQVGAGMVPQQPAQQQPPIQRDFWGFPVRPMQGGAPAQEGNDQEATGNQENQAGQANQGGDQQAPPPWI
ncbi:hypothetical protein ACFO4N_15655 [Camelliibacillus cellulosilyticus]|uniref:Uncharacterized protein n=1 Tax=Camelliibacillus cellulosilyticus TaxID=2174486 RepID=A0ABV9GSK0_9BACL